MPAKSRCEPARSAPPSRCLNQSRSAQRAMQSRSFSPARMERQPAFWLTGPVTLIAHGETVTLRNPVTITARTWRAGHRRHSARRELCRTRVASESGPADSRASLQALAIVVRTFALHEPHGHLDYDLCDSTHCQLLHWGGNPTRQPAAHAATLATSGETLWFHGRRAPRLLPQGLRRTHGLARRDMAARARGSLSALAAGSLLLSRRQQRVGLRADARRTHRRARIRRAHRARMAASLRRTQRASRAAPSLCVSMRRNSPPSLSSSPSARRWDGTGFPAHGSK